MRAIFFILLFAFLSVQSQACLRNFLYNEHGDKYTGFPILYRSLDTRTAYQFIESFDLKDKKRLSEVARNDAFQVIDIAFHLVCLERHYEALELTQLVNQLHPHNLYFTKSLGILHELTGNLDSAYFYIQKSEISPFPGEAHQEWVRLAVIKAKLAMQNDPSWIYNHQVLNLNLNHTLALRHSQKFSIKDTLNQIYNYLEATIPFTKAPNPIIANMMHELGLILENNISFKQAYIAFKIAEYYQEQPSIQMQNHLSNLEDLFEIYENEDAGFERPVLEDYFPDEKNFKKIKYCDSKNEKKAIKTVCGTPSKNYKEVLVMNEFITFQRRVQFRILTLFLGLIMLSIQLTLRFKNSR